MPSEKPVTQPLRPSGLTLPPPGLTLPPPGLTLPPPGLTLPPFPAPTLNLFSPPNSPSPGAVASEETRPSSRAAGGAADTKRGKKRRASGKLEDPVGEKDEAAKSPKKARKTPAAATTHTRPKHFSAAELAARAARKCNRTKWTTGASDKDKSHAIDIACSRLTGNRDYSWLSQPTPAPTPRRHDAPVVDTTVNVEQKEALDVPQQQQQGNEPVLSARMRSFEKRKAKAKPKKYGKTGSTSVNSGVSGSAKIPLPTPILTPTPGPSSG